MRRDKYTYVVLKPNLNTSIKAIFKIVKKKQNVPVLNLRGKIVKFRWVAKREEVI